MNPAAPVIAIFPWGDVIEEFLTPLGLTIEDFAGRMSGGWLFGYVAALQRAGWRPIIVAASEQVGETRCLRHEASGGAIWLVPGRRSAVSRSDNVYSVRRWLDTPCRAFRQVLEQERCSALIVQEYEYGRFDVLVRLARRLGIPALASFQGGDRTLSRLEALVRPRSMALCSALIIASSGERVRVEKSYRRHPEIRRMPNPLDVDEWRATDRGLARRHLDLPEDQFIVINHGRIDIQRKGLDVLLSAWARMPAEDLLVIVGSGQDHAEFSRLIEASGLTNVHWISSYTTDRAALRQWLSAADIYVSASRIEGMPVAPLEAMACGLPIVATDAQGLPDILADGEKSGGILVKRDDPAALAAGLRRLRDDPVLRRELGEAARRRVESAFSIEAASETLDVDTILRLGRSE